MKPRKPFNLNVWPVVQRELREGARRPFNYWLRVIAASAGILMVVYLTQSRDEEEKVMGLILFMGLHLLLMGLICLVVPWMTADCIAREKREGTLGLLFLTSLTAGGIVAGKGLAQALRALTMWVSVAPVLTLPFVTGGIGWEDATSALALEFSALVLCLAAGLLASTLVKGRGAAFVLALLLGACFVAVFCELACQWFLARFTSTSGFFGPFFPFGYHSLLFGYPVTASLGAANGRLWHRILWASPVPALVLFVIVLRFAAWRLANSWRDKTPSPRQESLIRKYCTPLFQNWFARRTRRTLDRNPIAWLQQYSWKARLGKWMLCLAFVVVAIVVLYAEPTGRNFGETTGLLFLLALAGGMTFAGINSFAAEKRSGALELILITPVSVKQIIFGRVWGLWKQFLPAALILALFDAGTLWVRAGLGNSYYEFFLGGNNLTIQHYLPARLLVAGGFMTLPVFALYFSLRVKNQIVAAALTWAALCLPNLFIMLSLMMLRYPMSIPGFDTLDIFDIWTAVQFVMLNLALALVACFLLHHSLSRRIYSF